MYEPDQYLIVGAGFSALATGLTLAAAGRKVIIIERDNQVGGLASDFELKNGTRLERFYHHWFKSDAEIFELIHQLGLSSEIREITSRTGMYYNKSIWHLSEPLDLMKFSPLSFLSRLRLGFTVLWVRRFRNWKSIEHLSIREWLEPICGKEAYSVIWEPLVNAKFSDFAEEVSAAWMWKKLVLRGSSRNSTGAEVLCYFQGGFGRLAEEMKKRIIELGGVFLLNEEVVEIEIADSVVAKVSTNTGKNFAPKATVFTGAPRELATCLSGNFPFEWKYALNKIDYLGNICLILVLNKSLSNTYWLNVNDPSFPFVGVIEHTNFVPISEFGNSHVVYLSRYLSPTHKEWTLNDQDYTEKSIDYLRMMFPDFDSQTILNSYIWKAPNAQPITSRSYSKSVREIESPIKNLYFTSMAQVYPEDRGTNYAVRNAIKLVDRILSTEKTKNRDEK